MEKKDAPLWISKFFKYSESLGGSLNVNYGFVNLDVSVFMFLFTKKLFDGQPCYNSYKISQELNKLSSEYMLEEDRTNYLPKQVSESLNRIEAKGFVIKNIKIDKKTRGRTPISEYQVKDLKELRDITQEKLKKIGEKKFEVISSLEDIEENVGYYQEKKERE